MIFRMYPTNAGVLPGRRTSTFLALFATVLALGTAACGDKSSSSSESSGPSLREGWHWETYHGVRVGVPHSWTDTDTSTEELADQWCTYQTGADPPHPVVARPGIETSAWCVDAAQGTRIATAGTFLGFLDAQGVPDGRRVQGDRTTVTINGVRVLVQAAPAVRGQIVRTIST